MVKCMPDQGSAANEHAILQDVTAPLATLPDDPVPLVADVDFPLALRGYDRLAVDAYVKKTSQLVAELQATRSPEAAIRRALERVGEQISGILQRAHETAEQITVQSRREAEDRLEVARNEAAALIGSAEQRVKELDSDTDRIWGERRRIVGDARGLAHELLALAESAGEKFPPLEDAVAVEDEADLVEEEAGEGAVEAAGGEGEPESAEGHAASEPGESEPEQDPAADVTAVMPPLAQTEAGPPPVESDAEPAPAEEHGATTLEHDETDR
jgi:hypothetical protein